MRGRAERERIDLHMHSVCSDGTLTVSQLVDELVQSDIGYFSLTDHDTLEGSFQMARYEDTLRKAGIFYLTGVELSCRFEGVNMHVLGYGFSLDNSAVLRLVAKAHDLRAQKADYVFSQLRDRYGIVLPQEKIAALKAQVDNIGKPHVAKLLMADGYGSSLDEVYVKYLKSIKAPDFKLDAAQALAVLQPPYAFASLAHPVEIMEEYGYSYEQLDELIGKLQARGLAAVEAFHSKQTPTVRDEFLAIAAKRNLFVTCGSDFHGANKPDVLLGGVGNGVTKEDYRNVYPFLLETMQ